MAGSIEVFAPDVGSLVEYGKDYLTGGARRWRVVGWYCELAMPERDGTFKTELDRMFFDASHGFEGGVRLRHCLRNEATHVGLTGVSGEIAPVHECKVVGRVPWSEDRIEDERAFATMLGMEGEAVF